MKHPTHCLYTACWALVFALLAGGVTQAGDNWPRFRGPNGTGISDAKTIPAKWSADDYRWKITLPGEGHSSPVVWGEKLFTLCTDTQTPRRMLVCLDAATGKTLWQHDEPTDEHRLHRFNSFAASSPAVDAERVYVNWTTPGNNRVLAFDHAGKKLWEVDLGRYDSQHGSGVSPMLYGDMVIIAADHQGDSAVVAFDQKTGKVRWRTARPSGRAAYATPTIYRRDGFDDMLLLCSDTLGISALDPKTGKMHWHTEGLFDKRTILSPVVVGDVVYGSCGSGGGARNYSVGLKLDADDPTQPPKEVYRIRRASPYVPTAVGHNGMLFLVSDSGIGTCLDAATGEVKWRQRLGGDYFASPVCIDGVIYAVSRDGQVLTFKATDTYQEIARMDLGEPSHATPAVANGRLYLRTLTQLFCLGDAP